MRNVCVSNVTIEIVISLLASTCGTRRVMCKMVISQLIKQYGSAEHWSRFGMKKGKRILTFAIYQPPWEQLCSHYKIQTRGSYCWW